MHNGNKAGGVVGTIPRKYGSGVELGDIMILSFIVILKCHDNQN